MLAPGHADPERTFRTKEGNHPIGAEHEVTQPAFKEAAHVVLIDATLVCSGSDTEAGG
jgi:hypothetical protein